MTRLERDRRDAEAIARKCPNLPLDCTLKRTAYTHKSMDDIHSLGKICTRIEQVTWNGKALKFRIWLMKTKQEYQSLGIEEWVISGANSDIDEAMAVLREGMVVAIKGHRVTSFVNDSHGMQWAMQTNVCDHIDILSTKGGIDDETKKEIRMYDRTLA